MLVKLVVCQVDLLQLLVDREPSEHSDDAFVPEVVSAQIQLLEVAFKK